MNILRLYIFLLSVLAIVPAYSAKHAKQLPAHLSGSMMPYDFSKSQLQPVWPDSLTPVYVARVARHGARYITSAKKLDRLKAAVQEARKHRTLTKDGERFAALLTDVEQSTGDQWGRLSEVGVMEEQRLAQDFYSLLPSLMKEARVNAISSYVPRVVKTMYEFTHQLAAISSHLSISTSEGRQFDWLVRCFDVDGAYSSWRKNGGWTAVVDAMTDSIVSPDPARRFFGRHMPEKDARRLTLDIYDILQSLSAFGMSGATDSFMTEKEYEACWQVDNLAHYLRNSISPLSSLAGQASAPLLSRIIADADRSLGSVLEVSAVEKAHMPESDVARSFDANFYFGHAETLMPLLSLMRVPGCYDVSPDLSTLHERWKDYDVVPLGANLDMILLSSPSRRVYVALRHNERFVSPMPGSGQIVAWDAYKAYLTDIMTALP